MKKIAVPLILCFLLQFANASFLPQDCLHLNDWQKIECENILSDSSLSVGQKEELYLNLIDSQGELASYDFAWNWNLASDSIPEDVVPKNSGIIQNAWLKIISIDKGFFDKNFLQWFAIPKGKVFAQYNFDIIEPVETLPGDCETTYSHEILSENLETKLNGNTIGFEKTTNFETNALDNEELVFSSALFLQARLTINHFVEHKYCFFVGPPNFWECFYKCEYHSTEYRNDSIELGDEFRAKTLIQNAGVKTLFDKEKGLLIVLLDMCEPVNGFELFFGKDYFYFSGANFDLGTTGEFLQIERTLASKYKSEGFSVLDFSVGRIVLGTTSSGPCHYKIYSDFFVEEKACDLVELKPTLIKIQANSQYADFEGVVDVNITLTDAVGVPLANQQVFLVPGDEKIGLKTDLQGIAKTSIPARGTLIARFEGNEEFASSENILRLGLFDSRALGTTEQVVGFFGAYYFIFLVARKFWVGL